MSDNENSKRYDLEDRTFNFAKRCRNFIKNLPNTISNREYNKQLIRASGSQAANYIEACEALSKKDFYHRIKICRKESKESKLWLRLCESEPKDKATGQEQNELIQEAYELTMIFNSIANKGNLL